LQPGHALVEIGIRRSLGLTRVGALRVLLVGVPKVSPGIGFRYLIRQYVSYVPHPLAFKEHAVDRAAQLVDAVGEVMQSPWHGMLAMS
jgi:hypothetical protein